jgi:3-oxoacyl-[acyl-carrier protein] reductase
MKDRVVVVTGGGRGIGRAICARFASAGAQVVAASRSRGDLDETVRIITEAGGRCHACRTDVADVEAIDGLIDETVERFGTVHTLVNNAGVAPCEGILDLEPEVFESMQAVNVNAVFHLTRRVWPLMAARRDGVIISISSAASLDPFPGLAAYGASKAWVNAWTRGLAEEGRSLGIGVFAVAPGGVETKMLRDAFPDYPADKTLSPEDVAEMVFTLAEPRSRFASGQTVFIRK